jgi:hypothetical protein
MRIFRARQTDTQAPFRIRCLMPMPRHHHVAGGSEPPGRRLRPPRSHGQPAPSGPSPCQFGETLRGTEPARPLHCRRHTCPGGPRFPAVAGLRGGGGDGRGRGRPGRRGCHADQPWPGRANTGMTAPAASRAASRIRSTLLLPGYAPRGRRRSQLITLNRPGDHAAVVPVSAAFRPGRRARASRPDGTSRRSAGPAKIDHRTVGAGLPARTAGPGR